MKRTDLLDTLKMISPALASRDFIPILVCYCFDPKTVTAFDDVVAMTAPLVTGLKGGIKGDVMLNWLANSRAPEVEIKQEDKDVSLKAGRSRIKLTALPAGDFVFEWPKDEANELPLNETVLAGFRKCLVSMGQDPSQPWQSGITMALDKDRMRLYSTNNTSASLIKLDLKVPKALQEMTLLLPPRFCTLLVNLMAKNEGKVLRLNKRWAEAQFENGLRMLSKAGKADVKEYQKVFSKELASSAEEKLCDMPAGLAGTLARNLVVLSKAADKFSKMSVADGKLKVVSRSDHGEVTDYVKLPGHPDCEVELQPDLLAAALDHAKQICFMEGSCAVLKGKGFTHVVAVVNH